MSFKSDEANYEKAEQLFEKSLMCEIERLAMLVINTHKPAIDFCMGMGSVSFSCVWNEFDPDDLTDSWERDENLSTYELADVNCYAEELDNLIRKWDSKFCLTGNPMRITRDNVTGKLLRVSDW